MVARRPPAKPRSPIFKYLRWSLILIWAIVMVRHVTKPMPAGTDLASPPVTLGATQAQFLYDLTTRDALGRPLVEQRIFDAVLSTIDQAQQFVVVDYFLFNDDMGLGQLPAQTASAIRPLSRELADRLMARKRALPSLQVLLITDPINDVYGGRPSPLLDELSRNGIDVVRTDLDALRDSNPAYSAAWRMVAQWFGNSPGTALPDPFRTDGDVSVRSWLALLNFKANHRKVIVADTPTGEWVSIVASANPHDASSLHSNVALRVEGQLAETILQSELQVARFSGWQGKLEPAKLKPAALPQDATLQASFVTEGAIRDVLVGSLNKTVQGDQIAIAMFYLSDRRVIDALLSAVKRGVTVRLILDPNKDAFGLKKDGVPNRPVAQELVTSGGDAMQVRWYRTFGEQFHTKLVLIKTAKQLTVNLGSANLTRRNIGNYNLEANVQLAMPNDSALANELWRYFDLLWNNDERKLIEYTAPFGAYEDDSRLRYLRYRIMEATGLSTF